MASPNLTVYDHKMFRDMLMWDVVRGKHSTGVCAVDKYGDASVYKKALASPDFIQLNGYNQLMLKADSVLMGHNRYATLGAKDDNNAHPFQHGHITLVHNGTLTVSTVHQDKTKKFATDSESICYALYESDDWKEVLESLDGAYALVWHDSRDNSLHFARNAERNLYIGWSGTDVIWSSLKHILSLAEEHHKTSIKEIELLPVGKLWSLDLNTCKSFEEEEFTPKKPRMRTYGGTRRGGTTTTNTPTTKTTMPTVYNGNCTELGAKKRGWLFDVRSTGFFRASTNDGETLEGHVPIDNVGAYTKAMHEGVMVEGVVRSSTLRAQTGEEILFLSAKHLKLVNDTAPTTCAICFQALTADDEIEVHGSEHFHAECLDAYLNGEQGEDNDGEEDTCAYTNS